MILLSLCFLFFNDTATTEIYTLSLHDALPIYRPRAFAGTRRGAPARCADCARLRPGDGPNERPTRPGCTPAAGRVVNERSEEHTSELQSRQYLVCRLLLEKKKKHTHTIHNLNT